MFEFSIYHCNRDSLTEGCKMYNRPLEPNNTLTTNKANKFGTITRNPFAG